MGALGFTCLQLFCPTPSTVVPATSFTFPFDSKLLPLDTQVIFISGSERFTHRLHLELLVFFPLIMALDHGVGPPSSWRVNESWFMLQHSQYDGVTSGSWWLGASFPLPALPPPLPTLRRLHHLLDPLIQGSSIVPPDDIKDSFPGVQTRDNHCHPGGLWPIQRPSIACICPLVFTKGWVLRPLTLAELARCMDIPASVIPQLKPVAPQRYKTLPLLKTAPLKVLLAFGSALQQVMYADPGRHTPPTPVILASDHNSSQTDPNALDSTDLSSDSMAVAEDSPPELLKLMGEGRERAAKDDDARIAVELWDEPFWIHFSTEFRRQHQHFWVRGSQKSLLCSLRAWLLRLWRKRVYLSFRDFMRDKYGIILASVRVKGWDGHPICLKDTPPAYRKPQPKEPDRGIHLKVQEKLSKFISRGYIVQDRPVTGLVSYFTVPKGDSDVRVVFDGTKSGLNDVIWTPTFGSPTIDSLLPMLEPGTWQGDIDVAEQFYNYMLDPHVQPYCGVDVTPYLGDIKGRLQWLTWTRCVMGLRSSPHGCVKMHHLGEEVVRGDHKNPSNPFFFDQIRLNLPGDPSYDPALARVSKINSKTGRVAGDMATYVDDVRPTAATFHQCLRLCHRVGSILAYLGIQDAARKWVPPSQRTGAWTGSVAHTDKNQIVVMCTQEKWDKARPIVLDIQRVLLEEQGCFNYKKLEQQRGFLVYVVRTYPLLVPYLKGIHLTLDSWRPNRDADGWKDMSLVRSHLEVPVALPSNHPPVVHAVQRLASDVHGLLTLMHSEVPPKRLIRSRQILMVVYGFGEHQGQVSEAP
jgi:hypothetical protein